MKLRDFLIGIGVFALFTVIVFSAINTSNSLGIYSENYLNITHDEETEKSIINITSVGQTTEDDFQGLSGGLKEFTNNRSASQIPTEGNLIAEAIAVLVRDRHSTTVFQLVYCFGNHNIDINLYSCVPKEQAAGLKNGFQIL